MINLATSQYRRPLRLLSAVVFLAAALNAGSVSADEFQSVLTNVLEARENNQAQLRSCVVVWDRTTRHDGFIKGRRSDTKGTYKMWMQGEKIATESWEERMMGDPLDPNKLNKVEGGDRKVFNGVDFRHVFNKKAPKDIAIGNQAEFTSEEDWLSVIGWGEDLRTPLSFAERPPANVVVDDWKVIEERGTQLLRFVLKNKEDGGTISTEVDLLKGCCITLEEWYTPEGQLSMRATKEVEEVSPQLWMPVVVETKSLTPGSQKVELHHRRTLRRGESQFNEEAVFPSNTFDISITKNMEVSDFRGLAKIIYSDRTAPLPKDELDLRVAQFLKEQGGGSRAGRMWPALILSGAVLAMFGVTLWWRQRAGS